MNSRPKPSAVVFAKDVERLARFYGEVVGMHAVHTDKGLVVLDEDGFQLVVHGIPEQIAATIRVSTPPSIRQDRPIKICLPVPSIDSARTRAAALGGMVGPKAKEWAARDFRACDGYDPEGNVFQLRERAD
jgi:predicted enzyme related to lactoylglutathione lyase